MNADFGNLDPSRLNQMNKLAKSNLNGTNNANFYGKNTMQESDKTTSNFAVRFFMAIGKQIEKMWDGLKANFGATVLKSGGEQARKSGMDVIEEDFAYSENDGFEDTPQVAQNKGSGEQAAPTTQRPGLQRNDTNYSELSASAHQRDSGARSSTSETNRHAAEIILRDFDFSRDGDFDTPQVAQNKGSGEQAAPTTQRPGLQRNDANYSELSASAHQRDSGARSSTSETNRHAAEIILRDFDFSRDGDFDTPSVVKNNVGRPPVQYDILPAAPRAELKYTQLPPETTPKNQYARGSDPIEVINEDFPINENDGFEDNPKVQQQKELKYTQLPPERNLNYTQLPPETTPKNQYGKLPEKRSEEDIRNEADIAAIKDWSNHPIEGIKDVGMEQLLSSAGPKRDLNVGEELGSRRVDLDDIDLGGDGPNVSPMTSNEGQSVFTKNQQAFEAARSDLEAVFGRFDDINDLFFKNKLEG